MRWELISGIFGLILYRGTKVEIHHSFWLMEMSQQHTVCIVTEWLQSINSINVFIHTSCCPKPHFYQSEFTLCVCLFQALELLFRRMHSSSYWQKKKEAEDAFTIQDNMELNWTAVSKQWGRGQRGGYRSAPEQLWFTEWSEEEVCVVVSIAHSPFEWSQLQ